MSEITSSREDYLEAILALEQDGSARSVDVAASLGYSRASVSRAMGILKREGFVDQEPYGLIRLTERGRARAKAVRRRHELLKYYLLHILEVDDKTAEEDACRMEHVISDQTLQQIEAHSARHMREFHPEQEALSGWDA
ncbi:MAG: metal-dependent transcriptional regulator [Oscillospiraceae bacterium]|jgi:DtxR family Mn-dependent transcriptional regulator|nr:metal-dependent transcriptional regulator [Oscillospiraceae bacterium]